MKFDSIKVDLKNFVIKWVDNYALLVSLLRIFELFLQSIDCKLIISWVDY
jgi:hypothetical protein